jgi:hypothetical protein
VRDAVDAVVARAGTTASLFMFSILQFQAAEPE